MSSPGPAPQTERDPASGAYLLEDQVGFVLRQVQQRHTTIFAAAFGEDMTPLQWAALAKLHDVGECSQNQLGRLVATDVATIKGVVERLVRRGLVETRPDSSDRRRLLLRLSAGGHTAYAAGVGTALAVTEATFGPLVPAERAQLLGLLDRLR
ncbi:MarR family winged helix-turn-helix transcriptional regulator [Enterovirga sp.]|uniref:MarR family winged helix-turn-helix transcriptional regulator n=1 Tax=Enterovirga sp. TaxID=2026350 RepID=UPI0026319C62|nr:MarR family winged helix-turn-helix transcriptional regulator [Enterovirga sp.]MDB5590884.1 marR [Enterovirga sp.]